MSNHQSLQHFRLPPIQVNISKYEKQWHKKIEYTAWVACPCAVETMAGSDQTMAGSDQTMAGSDQMKFGCT